MSILLVIFCCKARNSSWNTTIITAQRLQLQLCTDIISYNILQDRRMVTSLIRQGWCFWQHLPASYSPYTIHGSCSQHHGSISSWLTTAAVSADSEKSASTLRSRGKDGCITWHLQSTQNINPRSAHRVKAPSRTPSRHVATYPGSSSPAS